jgi:hypothetical protein
MSLIVTACDIHQNVEAIHCRRKAESLIEQDTLTYELRILMLIDPWWRCLD